MFKHNQLFTKRFAIICWTTLDRCMNGMLTNKRVDYKKICYMAPPTDREEHAQAAYA